MHTQETPDLRGKNSSRVLEKTSTEQEYQISLTGKTEIVHRTTTMELQLSHNYLAMQLMDGPDLHAQKQLMDRLDLHAQKMPCRCPKKP